MILVSLLTLMLTQKAHTQEFTGGEGSVNSVTGNAFSLPAKNSSTIHRKSFMIGNSLFNTNWVIAPASVKTLDGLGPLFNANSCSACHFKDGRGHPPLEDAKPGEIFTSVLIRLSVPGKDIHGAPLDEPSYGGQFNHRSIIGVPAEGDVKIIYKETKDKFPDGEIYSLIKPQLEFSKLAYGDFQKDTMFSVRVSPQMIGLGLLEAIKESDILKKEDPNDKDHDGISGRANFVWNYTKKRRELGRFGWKANQPDIHQQNASAFLGDIGITSKLFPQQSCTSAQLECKKAYSESTPEISEKDLKDVEIYSKILAVPIRRNMDDADALKGEKLFKQMNCIACHTESYVTGIDKEFPENSKQKIYPYTDMLLHEMGEGLADNRPDFDATVREWRTPPLWGIGLFKAVNNHTRYLHDGRARNIQEAILWHDGEALSSKNNYVQLTKTERQQVLKFLESL
ncbi:MAG: c-type cytochrome [Rhizobacter sp.]|nr:c-type cytochrome [Bacteriovorax sp.]